MISVYGANGYTGRRIARALVERGHPVLLSGRSRASLEALAGELGGAVGVRVATLDDPEALAALAGDSNVIVNCAGPFSATTQPVAQAAIAGRAHYLDISAEQSGTRWCHEQADELSRSAGVALLPSFGFYALPADLLTAIACDGLGPVAEVDIAYWIGGWRPSHATAASRLQGMREWFEHDLGAPRARDRWPATTFFEFPEPIGRRRVGAYPSPEVFTIPRHIDTRRVTTRISTSTLAPHRLGALFPIIANGTAALMRTHARALVEAGLQSIWRTSAPGAKDSDPTRFLLAVHVRGERGQRQAWLRGSGIYDITAPIAAKVALLANQHTFKRTGALAPAQVVEPAPFLDSLARHGLSYQLTASDTQSFVGATTASLAPTQRP